MLIDKGIVNKIVSIIIVIAFLSSEAVYPEEATRSLFKNKRPDYERLQQERQDELEKSRDVLYRKGPVSSGGVGAQDSASIVKVAPKKNIRGIYIPEDIGDEENYRYLLSGKRKSIEELMSQMSKEGNLRVPMSFSSDSKRASIERFLQMPGVDKDIFNGDKIVGGIVNFSLRSKNNGASGKGQPTRDIFIVGADRFEVRDIKGLEKIKRLGVIRPVPGRDLTFTVRGEAQHRRLIGHIRRNLFEAIRRSEFLYDGYLHKNISIILADKYDYIAGDHRQDNLIILNASDIEEMIEKGEAAFFISELLTSVLAEELAHERGAGSDARIEAYLAKKCAFDTEKSIIEKTNLLGYIEFMKRYVVGSDENSYLSYLENAAPRQNLRKMVYRALRLMEEVKGFTHRQDIKQTIEPLLAGKGPIMLGLLSTQGRLKIFILEVLLTEGLLEDYELVVLMLHEIIHAEEGDERVWGELSKPERWEREFRIDKLTAERLVEYGKDPRIYIDILRKVDGLHNILVEKGYLMPSDSARAIPTPSIEERIKKLEEHIANLGQYRAPRREGLSLKDIGIGVGIASLLITMILFESRLAKEKPQYDFDPYEERYYDPELRDFEQRVAEYKALKDGDGPYCTEDEAEKIATFLSREPYMFDGIYNASLATNIEPELIAAILYVTANDSLRSKITTAGIDSVARGIKEAALGLANDKKMKAENRIPDVLRFFYGNDTTAGLKHSFLWGVTEPQEIPDSSEAWARLAREHFGKYFPPEWDLYMVLHWFFGKNLLSDIGTEHLRCMEVIDVYKMFLRSRIFLEYERLKSRERQEEELEKQMQDKDRLMTVASSLIKQGREGLKQPVIEGNRFNWAVSGNILREDVAERLGRGGKNRLARLNAALDIVKEFFVSELGERDVDIILSHATQNGFELYKGSIIGRTLMIDHRPGINLALFYSRKYMNISDYTRAFFMVHEFEHALGLGEKDAYEGMVRFLVQNGIEVARRVRDEVARAVIGVGGPSSKNLVLDLVDEVIKDLEGKENDVDSRIEALVKASEYMSRSNPMSGYQYLAGDISGRDKEELSEITLFRSPEEQSLEIIRWILVRMLENKAGDDISDLLADLGFRRICSSINLGSLAENPTAKKTIESILAPFKERKTVRAREIAEYGLAWLEAYNSITKPISEGAQRVIRDSLEKSEDLGAKIISIDYWIKALQYYPEAMPMVKLILSQALVGRRSMDANVFKVTALKIFEKQVVNYSVHRSNAAEFVNQIFSNADPSSTDNYKVLGLQKGASLADIDDARRILCVKFSFLGAENDAERAMRMKYLANIDTAHRNLQRLAGITREQKQIISGAGLEIMKVVNDDEAEIRRVLSKDPGIAFSLDERVASIVSGKKNLLVLVNPKNAEILGYVFYTPDGDTAMYLDRIFIVPEYRQRGIAGILITKCQERFDYISLDNLPETVEIQEGMARLYKRLGFVEDRASGRWVWRKGQPFKDLVTLIQELVDAREAKHSI